MKRIIGNYIGTKQETLIIAIAAMHGNEPAGVHALRQLFQMLEEEPSRNPDFQFRGKLIGILGNLQAYERKLRYVKQDLNRIITPENISRVQKLKHSNIDKEYIEGDLAYEDLELLELIDSIKHEITSYQPQKIIVLDLHTTSATGGIFTLVSEEEESFNMALSLYAPVVKGFVKGVGGSSLHYFNTQNLNIPTTALAFEAGQHEEAKAVNRSIAWLVNALRAVGCIRPQDVDNKHEQILRGYSQNLPKAVQLIGVHKITEKDKFKMQPNYINFQAVKKDEILAYDKNGVIAAPEDCLILMPLYQSKGTDGFFLVRPLNI